jgi:hypothetical protein
MAERSRGSVIARPASGFFEPVKRSNRLSGLCTSVHGTNRWPHGIGRANLPLARAESDSSECLPPLNIAPITSTRPRCRSSPVSKARQPPARRARDLSSGSEYATGGESARRGPTLTTLYLQFEKEAEAALGLPPNVHSYALLPIGYPLGRFGPVRRVPLADVVYKRINGASLLGISSDLPVGSHQ